MTNTLNASIRPALFCLLLAGASLASGCMFASGGVRELQDHGDNARYENKDYWEHVVDAAFEDDDDDCRTTTTVVVHHH